MALMLAVEKVNIAANAGRVSRPMYREKRIWKGFSLQAERAILIHI